MATPPRIVDISGYVFPWQDDIGPALLTLDGSDDMYLPIFSTIDKLRVAATLFNIPVDRVKHIDSGNEFLDSVRHIGPTGQAVRIMLDPFPNDGNTCYSEIA